MTTTLLNPTLERPLVVKISQRYYTTTCFIPEQKSSNFVILQLSS